MLDVEGSADGFLDLAADPGLGGLQPVAVGDGVCVGCHGVHAVARVKDGGRIQLDGHADKLVGRVFLHTQALGKGRFRLKGGFPAVLRRRGGHEQSCQQREDEQEAEQASDGGCVLHRSCSFVIFLPKR